MEEKDVVGVKHKNGSQHTRSLQIVSISDIHLGHLRVPAESLHHNLKEYLYPKLTDKTDLLCISGDFFHTLLDLNSSSGLHATQIIDELILLAKTNKFYIRVVRGTFSHDRFQNQMFTRHKQLYTLNGSPLVDLFNNIAVEYIESLDLNILYVPDDLPTEDGYICIQNKLSELQLGQVDIAMVHGYFEHLLPAAMMRKPPNTFDAKSFSNLVRGVVLNGHVHTPRVYRKVITNGSFDRLKHGEEERKGYFIIQYDKKNSTVQHEFVENEAAAIFRSIDLSEYNDDSVCLKFFKDQLTKILKVNRSAYDTIHIHIVANNQTVKNVISDYISLNFPYVRLTKSSVKGMCNDSEEDLLTTVESLPIITESNIAVMLSEFIKNEFKLDISESQIVEVLND